MIDSNTSCHTFILSLPFTSPMTRGAKTQSLHVSCPYMYHINQNMGEQQTSGSSGPTIPTREVTPTPSVRSKPPSRLSASSTRPVLLLTASPPSPTPPFSLALSTLNTTQHATMSRQGPTSSHGNSMRRPTTLTNRSTVLNLPSPTSHGALKSLPATDVAIRRLLRRPTRRLVERLRL